MLLHKLTESEKQVAKQSSQREGDTQISHYAFNLSSSFLYFFIRIIKSKCMHH